ncbi:hypothetical protein A2U01_0073701, partial [Trifolium medium]|nr:hypothetical protein [Trifolium medium]
ISDTPWSCSLQGSLQQPCSEGFVDLPGAVRCKARGSDLVAKDFSWLLELFAAMLAAATVSDTCSLLLTMARCSEGCKIQNLHFAPKPVKKSGKCNIR